MAATTHTGSSRRLLNGPVEPKMAVHGGGAHGCLVVHAGFERKPLCQFSSADSCAQMRDHLGGAA